MQPGNCNHVFTTRCASNVKQCDGDHRIAYLLRVTLNNTTDWKLIKMYEYCIV